MSDLREQASALLNGIPIVGAGLRDDILDHLQPLFDQVERELEDERTAVKSLRAVVVRDTAENADLRAKLTQAEADYPEAMMRCLIGWLTADIPELHAVEVPRLDDSLRRFLSKGTAVALDRSVTP
jgi:hypothetical protein